MVCGWLVAWLIFFLHGRCIFFYFCSCCWVVRFAHRWPVVSKATPSVRSTVFTYWVLVERICRVSFSTFFLPFQCMLSTFETDNFFSPRATQAGIKVAGNWLHTLIINNYMLWIKKNNGIFVLFSVRLYIWFQAILIFMPE